MIPFFHYLPINEELFNDGFYVTGGGFSCIAPDAIYPPQQHPSFYHFTWAEGRILPEFGILLITEGAGVFESRETGLRRVGPGDVILLFPGIWHRYRPDSSTGWTEKWTQFNGEFVHKLRDRFIISSERPLLAPARFKEVEAELDALLTGIEQRPAFNSLRYALQVSHLLSLLTDSASATEPQKSLSRLSGQSTPDDALVAAAQDYIWTYSQFAISVKDIADHLGVSRRTLERRLSAALGRTVLDEVVRCRFTRAERLIRETRLPIKMVVYLAGFGKAENMRQAFMKQTRLSPRTYRARFLKEPQRQFGRDVFFPKVFSQKVSNLFCQPAD